MKLHRFFFFFLEKAHTLPQLTILDKFSINIRVGKNHDFFEKLKKSEFFDFNQIFLI